MWDLEKIEKMQNVKFPINYKKLYESGFKDISNCSKVCLTGEEILIDAFMGVDEIVNIMEEYYDFFGYDIIPVIKTKYDDYICFNYNKDKQKPSVIFWSYELALENPNEAIFHLYDNFDELIYRLK